MGISYSLYYIRAVFIQLVQHKCSLQWRQPRECGLLYSKEGFCKVFNDYIPGIQWLFLHMCGYWILLKYQPPLNSFPNYVLVIACTWLDVAKWCVWRQTNWLSMRVSLGSKRTEELWRSRRMSTESFCGNDLLRRSLYIPECGLVSIGKLTYQVICACLSTHGWNVQVGLSVRQGESWE